MKTPNTHTYVQKLHLSPVLDLLTDSAQM